MLKNYIKIAIRNLRKYPFISFINLFGLTIGLSCCFLILGYILHELSYDRYHKNAGNIYRLGRTFLNPESGDLSLELGTVAPAVTPLLENDFPEIRKITRFYSAGTVPLRYEEKMFNERDVYYADAHLFDVFDVAMVKGNAARALQDPYSVLLSEEMARKYFGNEEPLNKVVRMDGRFHFKVTGVYKAFPSNSHIHPGILLSFATLKDTAVYGAEQLVSSWSNNAFFTYLLLPEGYDPKKLEARFPAFLNRHIDEDGGSRFRPSDWNTLRLQKLTDIHLRSHTDYEAEENGDIKRVYIFSAIALFVLLIACINYMNLSTARAVLRAREIGVRKVVGARRKELIAQFLSESVLLSWVATLLAALLTWALLPWLNGVAGLQIRPSILLRWQVLLPVLLVPFLVGVVSGMYPALFLSSFQPIRVLKGLMKVGGKSISFRKVLVVTQFAVSIVLIVCTAVVFRQLRYMQNKSLGYSREHMVNLAYNAALNDNYTAFKTALLSNAHVKAVGRSSIMPTQRLLDAAGSRINRGDSLVPTRADIKMVRVDESFLPAFGIQLLAGRNLSPAYGMDTTSFLINEAAVKALGLPSAEAAIGKGFEYYNRKGRLVGVFNDFHFESLHQRILPVVFFLPDTQSDFSNLSVKISGSNIPAALAHIENTWKRFLPQVPYEFRFMDENFDRLYDAERRQGTIFTAFACMAIFIACLGLFGLSAFAISQRMKEIGIRKVLGADVGSLVGLLSKDFLKLVVIAALLAFPVAWYAMHHWLQDFAYRIAIPWWLFLAAGVLAAAIALSTISLQAVKAATANPVKNLRTE